MDIILPKADDRDARLREARVDRPDRGEQRHGVTARPQPQGGLDRHLGLTAIDVGVIEDQNDVQGLLRLWARPAGYRRWIDPP